MTTNYWWWWSIFLSVSSFFLKVDLTAAATATTAAATTVPEYPDEIWIKSADLQPETVVYNEGDTTFYVSSYTKGTIYRIAPTNGDDTDDSWSVDSVYSTNDLISSTGFRVFNNTILYICSNSPSAVAAWTGGNTAQYNGKQGEVIVVDLAHPLNARFISLPDVNSTNKYHFCNDIAVDKEGNAYVSDSFAGAIYRIPKSIIANLNNNNLNNNTTRTPAEIWSYNSNWYTGSPNFGINGIALNSLQSYLVVSIYQTGKLWKVDVTKKNSNTLINIDNANILSGLDGLTFDYANDSIVYVTGNDGHTVYEFISDDQWQSTSLHYTYTCHGGSPTAVTNVGKNIYAINSYLFDNSKESYLLEKFHPYECSKFSQSDSDGDGGDDDDDSKLSDKALLGIYIGLVATIFISCSFLVTIIVYIRKQSGHNMSDGFYQNL